MDNQLAEKFQDVGNENEADQAMEDCLRNPVIVRIILENFSSKELLQISLVNKLWKYEARSVVSQRGNLIANLKSNQGPPSRDGCATIVGFVSDLPKLGAIPISGIKFDNDYLYERHVCSFTREDPYSIHALNLLDQLSLKTVSVNMRGPWAQFRNCPAFLLAKKVLQQFCGVLEELQLRISIGQGDYIEKVIQDCYFPRLKILKVSCHAFTEDIENYMRALLCRAPNLKSLHTNWNINSVFHLLQGTSVEFVYTTPVCAPFDEISDNAIRATRLEWMHLDYIGPGFNFERFNRVTPILLQAPRNRTLRYFHIDAVLAVPLMCYGVRLENVRILWMDVGHLELIQQPILDIVKNFDFTRTFPNLDKVYVVSNNKYVHGFPPDHINPLMERANAVLTEPLLDRAARIKHLCLAYWRPYGAAAQFFAEMFPNIQKLEITVAVSVPFGYIWNWSDLNELEVDGNLLPTTGNLDGIFCGIFPEEVEVLRLMDDEYLKNVNIVPVMPAISCLRKLRTLTLHHKHFRDEPFGDDDATLMFSKVTALLAFERQPGLVVSLKVSARTAPPALAHLEPYMTVTYDRLRE